MQKSIQREALDRELVNSLWNAIQLTIWDRWRDHDRYSFPDSDTQKIELLVKRIWLHYFKKPIDTIPPFDPERTTSAYKFIRDYFFNKTEWCQIYDFIEFLVKYIEEEWSEQLIRCANQFLETENAAYRIVSKEIVEITDENEIAAVETAIDKGTTASRTHLQRSLELISDRKEPDFRNSIKEAISAVEATCQKIAGKSATLSDCLKIINTSKKLHPAFEQAFHKLYGYTSDDGGIRHALAEDSITPSFADAKFMLVACSAFCNYVMTKVSELGIELDGS